MPVGERDSWIAALAVGPELKERLKRALTEDLTIDARAPIGLAPDVPGNVTRGATLSEPPPSTGAKDTTAAPRGVSGVDPMIGRTFAGVVIEKILGSGGMGRVYLGTDGAGGPAVALKVLLRTQRDENVRRRFDREARLLQKLRHPCIAAVLRTGVEEDGDVDIPYIVMEYVEGVLSITDYVFKQRLGIRESTELFLQVCDAVGHAHAQGYMHRDLKPANILVNRQGRVKVIDFGVARAVQVDSAAVTVRTETGQLVGTMQYMSPEQFKADPRAIDKRSDVYALTSVLYELLTGIQPHDLRGMPVHEAARIVCDTDPPDVRQCNPRVDEALAVILTNGLSRDQARRPDDAQALGRKLKGWLSAPAPTIEATIHPVHPDMLTQRTAAGADAGKGVVTVKKKKSTRPVWVEASNKSKVKGGWGGVTVISLLVVAAALMAFDVVPVRTLVERVRKLTSSVATAQAADDAGGAKPEKPPTPLPKGVAQMVQLRVVTAPEGAAISVNGESRGLSPAVVLTEVAPGGALQIDVAKEGWQSATTQWSSAKDTPLVVFNMTPTAETDAMQRVFVLDISAMPKGSSLWLTEPVKQQLKPGADAVLAHFTRQTQAWEPVTLVFEAADAAGKPLQLQIGSRQGKGTVKYQVRPDDARSKIRVRAY